MDYISQNTSPEQEQLVEVRHRQYIVNEIIKSSLPHSAIHEINGSNQTLISLTSIEDDALGEELQVIWELEPGARVYEPLTLPEITDFDSPQRLDAFLDAVRWGAASSGHLYLLYHWTDRVIGQSDYNLFFNANTGQYNIHAAFDGLKTLPIAEWQKMGYDTHSVIADPLFVDPEHDDYRLKPESPDFKLGFMPIDTTKIGIRDDNKWKQ